MIIITIYKGTTGFGELSYHFFIWTNHRGTEMRSNKLPLNNIRMPKNDSLLTRGPLQG